MRVRGDAGGGGADFTTPPSGGVMVGPPHTADTGRYQRRDQHLVPNRLQTAAAVLLPTTLLIWHATLYGAWIVDDAAITFAYARSIAAGAGPVVQLGADPVEGYSNPAWMALHVLGSWLGLFDRGTWFGVPDYVAFPKALAIALFVVTLLGCHRAARAITARPALVTAATGVLLAANPSFVIWVVSGLENSLLVAAAVWLAALMTPAVAEGRLYEPRTAVWCGLLVALAALTRPDGLVYIAAYPVVAVLAVNRGGVARMVASIALSTAAFAVPFGAYLAWRVAVFGAWLPNTAVAKGQALPTAENLERFDELNRNLGWPYVVVVLTTIVAGLVFGAPHRRALLATAVPFLGAVTAFVVLQADWMGQYRFATPLWALGALLLSLSVARLLAVLAPRRLAMIAVVVVVAAGVASSLPEMRDDAQDFSAEPTFGVCMAAEYSGHLVNEYATALGVSGGTVFTPDLGGSSMTSRLQLVDMAGLVDATIAKFWAEKDYAGLRDHIYDRIRPTFIKADETYYFQEPGLHEDPRLARDYIAIASHTTVDGTFTDYVRLDAVADQEKLAQLRTQAETTLLPAAERVNAEPLATCGDRLVP
ncbi:hypothetical protein [Pseudonocardia sp. TRM90224]|uniref:hypothetical protein n=1 Tax=Pseudonocardia sp. TRM90224 TaxID=2812678 RepID=UPI001E5FA7E9|nr:hypothetical protein [Pseudonocardia sp. TRM90224]